MLLQQHVLYTDKKMCHVMHLMILALRSVLGRYSSFDKRLSVDSATAQEYHESMAEDLRVAAVIMVGILGTISFSMTQRLHGIPACVQPSETYTGCSCIPMVMKGGTLVMPGGSLLWRVLSEWLPIGGLPCRERFS